MDLTTERFDVVIIGAGAAGMMCAIEAGKRGRSVLVFEHNRKPGEKIRISGGGRCNFTNIGTGPENFLSGNPKFAISALSRYGSQDFLALVERHGIAWHEKTLGQLFCDQSAQQIIDMLLVEMRDAGVVLRTGVEPGEVTRADEVFRIETDAGVVDCAALVVACGGKSIPKMGASGFGYWLAEQFGVPVTETRPALVPLTFGPQILDETAALSGVSVDAVVEAGGIRFAEALLFTHRGLSGPAILQVSSYWQPGEAVTIDLAPGRDVSAALQKARNSSGKRKAATVLAEILPARLAQWIAGEDARRIGDLNSAAIARLAERVNHWTVSPTGSEGYRTAEVTAGGVDTAALDAKTMQAKAVPGLYFVGEVVDVTGWLGGYNFQWAWSSGWAAGQAA